MAAEFKPGDRVRVQSDWSKLNGEEGTIETLRDGTDGPGCYVNLDRHGPGCHFAFRELEPAPAAPASGPEMRVTVDLLREVEKALLDAGYSRSRTIHMSEAVVLPIIARHLAERDARLKELERDLRTANGMHRWNFDRVAPDVLVCRGEHEKSEPCEYERFVPEDRARAAEAALAEIKQAVRDYHFALDTRQHGGIAGHRLGYAVEVALGMPWEQGSELRSRTITAEGAETGSETGSADGNS